MANDYCNLEEKLEPLAERVRETLVSGGDPEFHHDVSVRLLMLLEELGRNEHDLKLAHMKVLSTCKASATVPKEDMDSMDIAFCEVLEQYEGLLKLYGMKVSDPEGYRQGSKLMQNLRVASGE